MGQSKRIRRGTAGWQKLFSRQSDSGLSVQEFCRREGINAGLFRRWQSRLTSAESDGELPSGTTLSVAAPTPFIDLGELRPGAQRIEVRLDFGGGLVLSIARS